MAKLLDAYGRQMPSMAEREAYEQERTDAWGNWQTGLGLAGDKTKSAAYLPVWRVLDQELTSLFNGSDIARKIVSSRPEEMFRRGFDIEAKPVQTKKSAPGAAGDSVPGVTDSEKEDVLEYAQDYLDLNNNLLAGKRWGRLYGGALLLMGIDDGRMPWEPLDEDNIRDFYALSLVDRRYSYVQSQYAAMGASSQYGHAQVYLISNAVAGYGWDAYGATSIKTRSRQQLLQQGAQVALVHESRVIRFDGNDADVVTRQNLAGWTWSVLQVVYEAMRQFEGSFDSAAYLLSDASQGVFKIAGLFKAITSGQRAALAARLQMLEQSRSVFHGIALDAGTKDGQPGEDFKREPTSFAGVPDLLDKMMLRMASAADMPATKLWGRAPAGLNATGDADIRGWYDTIESEAKTDLAPIVKRVFTLLAKAKKGPLRGRKVKWDVHWHPLWSPTDKEHADTKLANAQADQIYIQNGVVTAEEVALGLAETYPRLNLEAREAAHAGGLLFNPYENEPPTTVSTLMSKPGEPLSPKAPLPLLGTTGSQVSAGNLPVVAAAEAAGSGEAGRQLTPEERTKAQDTPMQRGADEEAKVANELADTNKGKPAAKNTAPGERPPPDDKGGKPVEAAPGTEPTKQQLKDENRDKPKPAQKVDGVRADPSPSVYALDASICLVWDAAGCLLCVSRPEPPHELALPGGGCELGETPAHAAMRELREELGVTVSALRSHGTVVSPVDARTVHVYTAGRWAGVPKAKEAGTVMAWLTPEALRAQATLYGDTLDELAERGALRRPLAPGGAAPGQPPASVNGGGSPVPGPVSDVVTPPQPDDGRADTDPDKARDRYPTASAESTQRAAQLADKLSETAADGEAHRAAGKAHSVAAAAHRERESYHEAVGDGFAAAAHGAEAERHERAAAEQAALATKADAHDPDRTRGTGGRWSLEQATMASEAAAKATDAAEAGGSHLEAVKAHGLAARAHRYLAGRHENLKNSAAVAKHNAKALEHDAAATEHQTKGGQRRGDGEWNEADHPRDESGRFGEGGGEKGGWAKAAPSVPLFKPEHLAGLGHDVEQHTGDKAQLFKEAAEAHEAQLDMLNRGSGLDKDLGTTAIRGDKMNPHDFDKAVTEASAKPGPVLAIGAMKTEASADRKTRDENGGKYEKLTDVVRATVAVDSMAQMHEVVQHLQERGLKLAKLPADRFAKPMSTGYRDMNLKVQWPNGHVGELQLHLKPILEAKAAGHDHYERQRALAPKLATRSMTQGEWRAYDHAEREQRRLYGEAWHKAGGS